MVVLFIARYAKAAWNQTAAEKYTLLPNYKLPDRLCMQPKLRITGKIAKHALLAIIMIALGQLNLLTHLFETDAAHPNHCLVCAQLQTQGHGAISATTVALSSVPDAFPVIPRIEKVTRAFPHIPGARAPPAFSFS